MSDQLDTTNLADEAMAEAIRRYGPSGDVEGALIFFRTATGPGAPITDEDRQWAKEMLRRVQPT